MAQFILLVFVLMAFSTSVSAQSYGSGWYRELQATYGYRDNIARTYLSDERSDKVTSLSLGGGYSQKVGSNAQLTLSGYLMYNKHREWDALDNLGVSVGLNYIFQPTLSYDAPWYIFTFTATDFTYRESDAREGLILNSEFSTNKRISTEATAHIGYRHQNMVFIGKSSAQKRSDAAFDTSSHELFVGLDLLVQQSKYLFVEYAYRNGDIRSTVSGGLRSNEDFDASTIDPVFDGNCTTPCEPGYAYRQEGNVQLGTIGITFPLDSVSLDLTANYYSAKGDNDRSYEQWAIKLGFVWNF